MDLIVSVPELLIYFRSCMYRKSHNHRTQPSNDTKEKTYNWLSLPKQGGHNARQDPLNTPIRRNTEKKKKKKHDKSPTASSHKATHIKKTRATDLERSLVKTTGVWNRFYHHSRFQCCKNNDCLALIWFFEEAWRTRQNIKVNRASQFTLPHVSWAGVVLLLVKQYLCILFRQKLTTVLLDSVEKDCRRYF